VLSGGPPVVFSSLLHKYIIPSPLQDGKLRIQQTTVTRIHYQRSDTYLALFSIEDVTSLTDSLNATRGALHRLDAEVTERKRAEKKLQDNVTELKSTMVEIQTLRGPIPICASCKKIRDDTGYWTQLESYLCKHAFAEFSHGICPDCVEKLYPELSEDDTPETE
jgi:hypothetical protein